jgi:hypothetical protein
MLYPIFMCIDGALGVCAAILPDFENCSTTVADLKQLGRSVQQRIDLLLTDLTTDLPAPSPIEDLKRKKKYRGGSWMLVDIVSKIECTECPRCGSKVPKSKIGNSELDADGGEEAGISG